MDFEEKARREWADLARVVGVTPDELRELFAEAMEGLPRVRTEACRDDRDDDD